MHFEDPYEILGLKPEASREEVKAAYEKKMAEEEKKEEIQAAYDQITAAEEAEEKKEEKSQEISEEEKSEETSAEEKTAEEKSEEVPAEEKTAEEKPEEASAEEKSEEKKKATPGQIALGVAAVVALAAVLIALILAAVNKEPAAAQPELPEETADASEMSEQTAETAETTEPTIPADGNPDDETCKGSYSASDEDVIAAAQKVVARIPGYELTNAQLQIYYWMGIQSYMQQAGAYAQYMGLDVSRPLDSQACPLAEGQSWQQFFLKQAVTSWQNYQAMAAEAEKNGVEMPEDLKGALEGLPEEMEKQAKENGFADAKAMLANNVGAGAEISDYIHFMEVYNHGYGYFADTVENAKPDGQQLEEFFKEHEQELADAGITKDNKVCTARHILITPEDTESEEDWKEAEKKANELLKQYLGGEMTEENFGKLAQENTMDPGSKETGGLYEDFAQGQMVPPFDQWCFDAARNKGDTGIVKTDYGYHVMYFVSTRPVWEEQTTQAYIQQFASDLIEKQAEAYPLEVIYGDILLGELKAQ